MQNSRSSWKRILLTSGVAGALAVPLAVAPAAATDRTDWTVQVIASGLKNPRGVTALRDGTVLVAEAGEGRPGCAVGEKCVAATGAVFAVDGNRQGRVVTGLASVAEGAEAGAPASANGPSNVLPDHRGGYIVVSGLGGTTGERTALGADAATLGTVFRTSDNKVLADLTDHETRLNPDGGDVHANPWSLVRSGCGFLTTDAGANTVIRSAPGGRTSTAAVVPKNELPSGAAESVPTGIAKAADGTVYVADMSGGQVDASRIWKIAPGGEPEVLATGMTNLVDIALDEKGDLLALSYSQAPLAGPPQPGAVFAVGTGTGDVTEIPTDGKLKQPTGIEADGNGGVYITNKTLGTDGELVHLSR
ncbi:ScyD/ScyE family protein [Streptomyces luteolus]|uniref:ScyD/ScyE family protein n=1 Tax=Streptomyces luteolus TaxID=3043615 RepID=A0ABT6T4K8_9ACTN|nr:ScyD/ScyE family protein [Streptomyces sp. B-S-A12]MDI3422585.1 ScyD/ScyE family protein [Streptomyces sp. B-S-A12]